MAVRRHDGRPAAPRPAGGTAAGSSGPTIGRADPTGRRSLYFAAVNAEFNWWLLIVGLVVGAGLVWYVLMDARRREADLDATERPREAAWLSATLGDEGWDVPPEAVERLLVHHRAYLEAPPPDAVPDALTTGPRGRHRPAGPRCAQRRRARDPDRRLARLRAHR